MFPFRAALYLITIGCAFFFAYWEMKIKSRLTNGAVQTSESPSEIGVWNDFSNRIKRERFLKGLPREALIRLRTVVILKFVFIAILVIEVLVLQR